MVDQRFSPFEKLFLLASNSISELNLAHWSPKGFPKSFAFLLLFSHYLTRNIKLTEFMNLFVNTALTKIASKWDKVI